MGGQDFWLSKDFKVFSDQALQCLKSGDLQLLQAQVKELNNNFTLDKISILFIEILSHFLAKDYIKVLECFGQAKEIISDEQYGQVPYIYNILWLETQFAIPRHQNPVTKNCHQNYKNNIKALKLVDPELADQIQKANASELKIVDYWDGLHFFDTSNACILNISADIKFHLAEHVGERAAFAFDGVNTGQEVIYSINHQYCGLHGMARGHYLLEESFEMLRSFFELHDCSKQIGSCELFILGGENRFDKLFGLLMRHKNPIPIVRLEKDGSIQKICDRYIQFAKDNNPVNEIEFYYKSDVFKERLNKIASGDIMPRVFISTCRWTTFLKYCATDFEKAFSALGCETRFLIEDNDIECLPAIRHNVDINEFRPDFVFMVSHGRPSMPYIPNELSVICYLQDRCGPLVLEEDLSMCVSEYDIFICQASFFKEFLSSRNVDRSQYFVMPVPVDETQILPLEKMPADANKYIADISFVKHMAGSVEAVWNRYLAAFYTRIPDLSQDIKANLNQLLNDLFRRSKLFGPQHLTESEIYVAFKDFFDRYSNRDLSHFASNLAIDFIVTVATTTWRYEFVKAVAAEGFDLALYGANWDTIDEVSRYARGPLHGKEQLCKGYNLAKINLNINNVATMHQRLLESAMAKSFIITAGIPSDKDWEPASNHFIPGKELVIAESPSHMVELCKYYLEHEDERNEIATAMYKKALGTLTMNKGATKVIDAFKKRVSEILP